MPNEDEDYLVIVENTPEHSEMFYSLILSHVANMSKHEAAIKAYEIATHGRSIIKIAPFEIAEMIHSRLQEKTDITSYLYANEDALP